MSLIRAMSINASGLKAQRMRMEISSSNLANINSTRTADGMPFRRMVPVFKATSVDNEPFADVLQNELKGVEVMQVRPDLRDPVLIYDPGHPDADTDGYVAMPNINLMEEMITLIGASRSYEAGLMAIDAAKGMAMKALELGS